MRSTSWIEFSGRFASRTFRAFVDHRAARLDLDAWIEDAGPERFCVRVAGKPDLIDAFEMACSLGPLDCLVLDVTRRDGPAQP